MVNKIICSFFFIELIVALLIGVYWSANDIPIHQVTLSTEFLAFMKNCSNELNQFKLEIPQIPSIEYFNTDDNTWYLILNAFIGFVNGISGIINFLVMIINYLLELISFIFIMVKNLFALIDNVQSQPVSA